MVTLAHSTSSQRFSGIIETGAIKAGNKIKVNGIGAHPMMYAVEEFDRIVAAQSIKESGNNSYEKTTMKFKELPLDCSEALNKEILYKIRDVVRENYDSFGFTKKFSWKPPFKKESHAEKNIKAFLDNPEEFMVVNGEEEESVKGAKEGMDFILGYYPDKSVYEDFDPYFSVQYYQQIRKMTDTLEFEVNGLRVTQDAVEKEDVGPYLSNSDREWVCQGNVGVQDIKMPNMWVSMQIEADERKLMTNLNKSSNLNFKSDEPYWKQNLRKVNEVIHKGDVLVESILSVKFHSDTIEILESSYESKEQFLQEAKHCGIEFDNYMPMDKAVGSYRKLEERMFDRKRELSLTKENIKSNEFSI